MKTYKNLYLNFISDENIKLAVKTSLRVKREETRLGKF